MVSSQSGRGPSLESESGCPTAGALPPSSTAALWCVGVSGRAGPLRHSSGQQCCCSIHVGEGHGANRLPMPLPRTAPTSLLSPVPHTGVVSPSPSQAGKGSRAAAMVGPATDRPSLPRNTTQAAAAATRVGEGCGERSCTTQSPLREPEHLVANLTARVVESKAWFLQLFF